MILEILCGINFIRFFYFRIFLVFIVFRYMEIFREGILKIVFIKNM